MKFGKVMLLSEATMHCGRKNILNPYSRKAALRDRSSLTAVLHTSIILILCRLSARAAIAPPHGKLYLSSKRRLVPKAFQADWTCDQNLFWLGKYHRYPVVAPIDGSESGSTNSLNQ